MIKQIAIIGLGRFTRYLVDELVAHDDGCEILVVDKDPEMIDEVKHLVSASYIADVITEDVIQKLIPADIDKVVVDLGNTLEAACLVINYLRKMGIYDIMVKAHTEAQGDILRTLGAKQVILPHQAAAKRVAPLIISDNFKNFFPIDENLYMVEVEVPEKVVNRTLAEADLRNKYGINIIGVREHGSLKQLSGADYRLLPNQTLLIVGDTAAIEEFTGTPSEKTKRSGLKSLFSW